MSHASKFWVQDLAANLSIDEPQDTCEQPESNKHEVSRLENVRKQPTLDAVMMVQPETTTLLQETSCSVLGIALAGIAIPYPLSQLILERRIAIHLVPEQATSGYHKLRTMGWLWIIEKQSKTVRRMDYDDGQFIPSDLKSNLPGRSETPRIVGVVIFHDELHYNCAETFNAALQHHLVPSEHVHGWRPTTVSRTGWNVKEARRLASPCLYTESCTWGFLQPKVLHVQFATDSKNGAPSAADSTQQQQFQTTRKLKQQNSCPVESIQMTKKNKPNYDPCVLPLGCSDEARLSVR